MKQTVRQKTEKLLKSKGFIIERFKPVAFGFMPNLAINPLTIEIFAFLCCYDTSISQTKYHLKKEGLIDWVRSGGSLRVYIWDWDNNQREPRFINILESDLKNGVFMKKKERVPFVIESVESS